jgi:DNA-binding transcriptional LysR family regulator
MDIRFLESFIEVVEHGSLAEAARRLNLTPAAVAQRIRALERDIGARLVARSGRVVRPTEAGIAIFERSRLFLRDARDLRTIAMHSTMAGELRIGAISTAMTGLIPETLKAMIARHPNLEIYLEPGVSMGLYRKVVDGDLDTAIIVEPQFTPPKIASFEVIRHEPLIVIAPSNALPDAYALLRNEPFIRYDRNHWGGRLADDHLRKIGIRPKERFELDSLEAIAVMVDRGLGVSLVPDWPTPWPEGVHIAKVRLPAPAPARKVGVVWLKASPRMRSIRAFIQALT